MKSLFVGNMTPSQQCIGVIMAGGSGTRFWPASRVAMPKQFLALTAEQRSLIQATADRLYPICGKQGVLVVGGESQRELIAQHLPDVAMLLEPMPRNTAPCIGYAATLVLKTVGDVPMICVPADHVIHGAQELARILHVAVEHVRKFDDLLTIGIPPTKPETGYGYIKAADSGSGDVRKVEKFVEKPDLRTAEDYLHSGQFFWNSGIFVWRPSTILAAIDKFIPHLGEACRLLRDSFGAPNERDAIIKIFEKIDPVSIDVGVMERCPNAVMISGSGFEWSDVGSWSAWAECLASKGELDKDFNLLQGPHIAVDTKNCAVLSDKRLIALVGVEDLIVIETSDSVLVCHREMTQEVKKVVEALRAAGREDLI